MVSTEPPPEFTAPEIVAEVPLVDQGQVKLLKHPSQTTTTGLAQHVHDCDVCVFLGVYAQFDLWYCPEAPRGAGAVNGGSFLARHGNDGPDYSSAPLMTINFYLEKDPRNPLAEAYRRAKAKGLL